MQRHDGLVAAGPAGQTQAQGEVDVLQVGEVGLVEAAGVQRPRRGGTGPRRRRRRTPRPACPSGRRRARSARAARRRRRGAGRRRHRRRAAGSSQGQHLAGHRRRRGGGPRARRWCRASQSGASSTSVLTSATNSPRGDAQAEVGGVGKACVVRELDDPSPRGARRAGTPRDPSREPLSTTMTSSGRALLRSAGRPGSPGSHRRPFQLGMTTEITAPLAASAPRRHGLGQHGPGPPRRLVPAQPGHGRQPRQRPARRAARPRAPGAAAPP